MTCIVLRVFTLMYLWEEDKAFTNKNIINKAKFYSLDQKIMDF